MWRPLNWDKIIAKIEEQKMFITKEERLIGEEFADALLEALLNDGNARPIDTRISRKRGAVAIPQTIVLPMGIKGTVVFIPEKEED